jgi:hypothetical protein
MYLLVKTQKIKKIKNDISFYRKISKNECSIFLNMII